MATNIGIIFRVGGKNKRDHLSFALEAFRKQRADGAINHAAGKNFAFAGTAFALDESAGDASAGIGVFAVINGEREEIDSFTRVGVGAAGGENHVVAQCGRRLSRALAWLICQFQMRCVLPPESSTLTSCFMFISLWQGARMCGLLGGCTMQGECSEPTLELSGDVKRASPTASMANTPQIADQQ